MVSVTPWPRSTPEERTPGTHCTEGWVDPRAGPDIEARGYPLPLPGTESRNPSRPVCSQTLYGLSYPSVNVTIPTRNYLQAGKILMSIRRRDFFL
jgi:hypothetical protein